jgi:uncharacterized membrane protein
MDSDLVAARQGARAQVRDAALRGVRAITRPPSARTSHRAGVGLLTLVVAGLYCGFETAQYETYRVAADDTVIFAEAIQSYSHFKPGISPVKGLHFHFGPNFSLLGDHFSPILAVLAPLYWIHSSPLMLLLAQAVLFALAIPPLWVFTRRAFGGGPKAVAAAYLVCAAYAMSWPIASALAFNFHEVAFAPVLMAIVLERLQAGRLRTALIAAVVLLLVKEDMGLFLAGIGFYLAVTHPRLHRRQRLIGAGLVVIGVLYTWVASDVIIPAMGGKANYYWGYSALGANVPQAAWHGLTHPLSTLHMLIQPSVKINTMLWLFGAFCFLSLLSPVSLAALPLLLERMLATNPSDANWWATPFQYNAFLVVILACAAVDGAARLDRLLTARRARARQDDSARQEERAQAGGAASGLLLPGTGNVALACAAAMFVVGVALIPRFAFDPALHRSFYRQTAQTRIVAALDARVPSGVTVAALNIDGSQLSGRDLVLFWDGDGGTPALAAPWVVANVTEPQFTWSSVSAQVQRVSFLEHHGYKVLFSRGGYLLLRRPGPPRLTAGPSPGA